MMVPKVRAFGLFFLSECANFTQIFFPWLFHASGHDFRIQNPNQRVFVCSFFFFFLLEHENYTPIFFYFRPFHGPGMWFHDPKLNSRCQNLSVSNENATFFWLGGANFELVFLFSTISRPQDMISGPKIQIEDNSQSFRVPGKNAFSLFFFFAQTREFRPCIFVFDHFNVSRSDFRTQNPYPGQCPKLKCFVRKCV